MIVVGVGANGGDFNVTGGSLVLGAFIGDLFVVGVGVGAVTDNNFF